MPKYKSSFQEIWLNNEKYSLWLQKDEDTSLQRCKVCWKSFSVAAMDIKAFDAHANGAKHKDCLPKKDSIVSFIQKESVQPEPQKATSSKQCNISDMLQKEVVLKAELIWCLDVVQSKYSFWSSDNKSTQFASMFPDSRLFLWSNKMWLFSNSWSCPSFQKVASGRS